MRHPSRIALAAGIGLLVAASLARAGTIASPVGSTEDSAAAFLPLAQNGADDGHPRPTAAPTVSAPGSDALQILTQLGGMAADVTAADGLAYVAQGSGLTVYDVRNPAAPVPMGRAAPLGGVPVGLARSGDHVYVATSPGPSDPVSEAGLAVVDVSDPIHPTLVGRLNYEGGLADVAIAGTIAFVCPREDLGTRLQLLRALDLTEPSRPREVGQVALTNGSRRLAVQGTRVYTMDDVVDVTDPRHMWLVEPFLPLGFPARPSDLVAAGDRVGFVGSNLQWWSNNEAYVRWLSPLSPATTVTTIACPSEHDALGIARHGDHFLTVGQDGGCAFDAPADGSPPTVHGFEAPGRGTAVSVVGDVGYVATNMDWSTGPFGPYLPNGGALQTLDLTDPAAPRVLGAALGPTAFTPAAEAIGNRLFVVDGGNGQLSAHLWVLDASNPAAPRTLGTARLDSPWPAALTVDGDSLYLADNMSLGSWDVSEPSALRRIGQTDVWWLDSPQHLFERGNVVYGAAGERVYMVDVTDPTHPMTKVPEVEGVTDLVAGPADVGYWATADGIQAVRLGGGPPVPLGPALGLTATRLAVAGTTVYALDASGPPEAPPRIHIVDATDPGALRQLGTIEDSVLSRDMTEITATGDRLYLASRESVLAWDTERPLAPQRLGAIFLPSYALADGSYPGDVALSAWGDRAVIAQTGGGLTVVEATAR